MERKSMNSKLLLGVLILSMIASQVLGLYSTRMSVVHFITSAIPLFCIPPLLVIGLAIASWMFFVKKQYKKSVITTSLSLVFALLFLFLFWGATTGA